MKLHSYTYILIGILTLLSSCKKDKTPAKEIETPVSYLHISHTRLDSNPFMDSIVEAINFSKYNLLLLGGDLANLTSQDAHTMGHVDSIYHLSNPNTLWSLGNHDYTNPGVIPAYTNRPLHYSYFKNGITFLVLDTQADSSNISNAQLNLLNDITDTISTSTHLIILTHKLIWMYGNTDLESLIPQVSNAGIGSASWQINPNNFYTEVYTKLVDVQNRGIQVICIAGDIGFQSKQFEYQLNSGIQLLASGIHGNTSGNKGLIFEHFIESGVLTWKFVPIELL